MPFFKSFPDDAGPPDVFMKYPEVYGPWSKMSQELMNGPSPLSQAERELILAYAAGVVKCTFVFTAHSEVAYARGIEAGLIDRLLEDPESAPVGERFKPLLAFVHKLMLTPGEMSQADANAVFDARWNEHALYDAIAIMARAAFMQRLVEGHGFTPMSRKTTVKRAKRRVDHGYVNLYPIFRENNTNLVKKEGHIS